ncbi:MAG: PEP-CTERM sorting domain-containing protein [Armatimonadetes bacterium]|nr:PEP-CTERM sorting domain-containing protein [Armatimonadota bacterium]
MRNRFLGIGAVLALGSFAGADVVLDHITGAVQADWSEIYASQDFEAAWDEFDVNYIEDFTVTETQTNILQVDAIMGGYSGFLNAFFTNGRVRGYRVEFYSSVATAAASLTGDVGSQTVLPGSVTVGPPLGWRFAESEVRIPVNVFLPGAGTYWVGVMGILDYDPGGQIAVVAWNSGTFAGGNNSVQVNPNGGFNFGGGTNFVDRHRDAAYRITGVPEPASMVALAMGAAALVAHRRRKKVA